MLRTYPVTEILALVVAYIAAVTGFRSSLAVTKTTDKEFWTEASEL